MTAMKTGVYTILAVVVGVLVIALIPGQLSNLATPIIQSQNLQSGNAPENSLNRTTTNSTFQISGNIKSPPGDTTTQAQGSTKTDSTGTQGDTISTSRSYNPFNDVNYYGFWGIGLIVALTVYYVAKRIIL